MSLFEQLCYESVASKWGESNFYSFARCAADRSRSRTAVWNGDSHSNFTGLAYSVASGIRAGLVGFSQWAVDCGGYVRGTNDPEAELWATWMHFSTFSPAYEIIIGTNHTPWYPPYTNRLVGVLKQMASLHNSLLPYIKSYTYLATQTGIPLMRASFLEYPHDPKLCTIADSYTFGGEFLVAPIVNKGGARDVCFPSGNSYLEYFNKTDVYTGGGGGYYAFRLPGVGVRSGICP
jgi:alpha-D-xyloside xylohydrolase